MSRRVWRWKPGYRPPYRTDNRLAAIAYCENGFAIIPLCPGSKVPSIPSPHPLDSPERGTCHAECGQLGHGFHDARADVEWANEHWTARPHDGIAVRPRISHMKTIPLSMAQAGRDGGDAADQ